MGIALRHLFVWPEQMTTARAKERFVVVVGGGGGVLIHLPLYKTFFRP